MAEKLDVVEKYLCCGVCSEIYKDPVSLHCNHSFCQECLTKFWEQAGSKKCPECKRKSSMDMPGINYSLKQLSDSFTGRLHLDKCTDGGQETVKEKLQSELENLKKQLEKCNDAQKIYKDMVQHTKKQVAATERSISKVFHELHQFLREQEEARLAALRKEEEQKRKMICQEMKILQERIEAFKESIQHVENQLKQNNMPFLTEYQNTISRVQCTMQDTELMPGALIDEASHLGNLKFRVLEKMAETVQYNPVILDPNTANVWLRLSDDLTSVTEMNTKQLLLDNPERFMKYGMVLSSEGFTSGRHCWDVQVGDRRKWSLGVAKESVERKSETFIHPQHGFWTVIKTGDKYSTSFATLSLETKPQRIRVQLDYERGEVSFYDTSDMSHLYTYKDTFKDRLFPYFCTQTDESEAGLQVLPLKVSLTVKKVKVVTVYKL